MSYNTILLLYMPKKYAFEWSDLFDPSITRILSSGKSSLLVNELIDYFNELSLNSSNSLNNG